MDTTRLGRDEAEHLGRELQELAATQAGLDHEFCRLVDRFDAGEGIGWFRGLKTTAHFLAWACSMSPTVAREHVRVARALRSMPGTDALFAQGRLSYSKVRELTRLVGQVDESALLDLAIEMTASQLARTVGAYRSAAGTRIAAVHKRSFSVTPSGDGMVRISVCLPAEDAALVTAAVEAAARRGDAEAPGSESAPERLDVPAGTFQPVDRVQALVDVAASYLDGVSGEPADDHTLVIVHVDAGLLTRDVPAGTSSSAGLGPDTPGVPAGTSASAALGPDTRDVPAGTSQPATLSLDVGDVPAGTSASDAARAERVLRSGTCYVEGHGPIEAATAQRIACTARLVGAIVDRHGEVLALGRSTRLATRAQRRALRVRDQGICQFPGCHQTRHLDAHHLVPWSQGGATDLANMLLLCRRHHTMVHEGGLIVMPQRSGPCRFHVSFPDGEPITGTWREQVEPENLERILARFADQDTAADPSRIFPPHAGAGFSLHDCVRVLFDIQLPELATAA